MKPQEYKQRLSAIKEAIRYHKHRLAALDITLYNLNESAREQLVPKAEPKQSWPLMLDNK